MQRRAITLRALALGFAGVLFICGVTPFNNLVVNNTDFIGNHFPAGVLLLVLIVVIGINAPLSRLAPRFALRRDELIVMLSMWLIASALPWVGLNRYFPGQIASLPVHSADRPEYANLMRSMRLPDWLFPAADAKDPAARGLEDVYRGYFNRLPSDRSTFAGRLRAVPWERWITPALTWGVFIFALLGMGLFATFLWHRQWTDVERLPFPLASVYLSLIDTPPPGRWLSDELRAPGLWIAAAAVFFVHFFNGVTIYAYATDAPQIPLHFDLRAIFVDPPFTYTDTGTLFQQSIFFTIIGLMFFVRSNVGFSLWFFYLLSQAARMIVGARSGEITWGMMSDQIIGAATVMSLWMIWVSRDHLIAVGRSFFKADRDVGRPFERLCALGLLLCLATMIVWLTLAGASIPGAIVITLGLGAMYLLLARIIAETGLLYVLLPLELNRPWLYAGPGVAGTGAAAGIRTTLPSYFFSTLLSSILTHDTRQAIPGFASTAARMGDEIDPGNDRRAIHRHRVGFVSVLLATIVVSYFAAGASTLYVRYNYDVTLDRAARVLDEGDNRGSFGDARGAMDQAILYAPPKTGPVESHSRLTHVGIGAAIAAVLGFARMRFAAWPLDPVGYLLCWTWGIGQIWFSIFLGWMAKQLTLWLAGGAGLKRMRSVFIGLVVGETLGVIFWLVFSFGRALLGMEYTAIQILPS